LEDYLTWVHMTIRLYGWISATRAQDEHKQSTADSAHGRLTRKNDHDYDGPFPEPRDREAARDALAWVRNELIVTWQSSDYLSNLKITCKDAVINIKLKGIAASVFAAYDKFQEQERERVAAKASTWQGTVGKRQDWQLKCVAVRYSSGQYGTTSIYMLKDEQGNCYTWFSSNDVLEEGNEYKLKGTVKDHSEYQGIKQTILTRCKVM
jgi:hypothetical protein